MQISQEQMLTVRKLQPIIPVELNEDSEGESCAKNNALN